MFQLHLGVNSGALKFAIERQAINEATFRCPDELGWQPHVRHSLSSFFQSYICTHLKILVILKYDFSLSIFP